jgi:predicted AAA+ superfamily ATPase
MFTMNEHQPLSHANLKEIVLEQKEDLKRLPRGVRRDKLDELIALYNTPQIIIVQGVRRCGKSTLLAQFVDELNLKHVHYLNFEDERLVSFNVSMFNALLDVFYEVNGPHDLFIFDEVQVVQDWERFVRRLHNSGKKVLITGSNASLLTQELGTKLTGRHLNIELFPFTYREFLRFKKYQFDCNDFFIAAKRSQLHQYFADYMLQGGMPLYLQYSRRDILTSLYEDIIIRDVIQRYQIDNSKLFRELALYLLSNTTSSISYTKLKSYFHIGSVNTVIKYIGYLENCYFSFIVNPFSPSFKKQINAPKKIYNICNSFVDKIGFHVNDNQGVLLENLVYLELRKRFKNIFYYKTQNGLEVDFLVYDNPNHFQLIQVSLTLTSPKTKARELNALLKAMQETNATEGWILTDTETDTILLENKIIHVIPVYQWLLQ